MPPKAKVIKCRPKPPPPSLLGPVDQQEWYRTNARRTRRPTKIGQLWRHMLKNSGFTVPGLAALGIVSKNYVKVYIRILTAAGYLTRDYMPHGSSPHTPQRYSVGPHYKGETAPQLAGGAGGGGRLGAGWKTLEKKKAPK